MIMYNSNTFDVLVSQVCSYSYIGSNSIVYTKQLHMPYCILTTLKPIDWVCFHVLEFIFNPRWCMWWVGESFCVYVYHMKKDEDITL